MNSPNSNKPRYQISAETDKFDFSDQICLIRIFKRKSEHRHGILHIRIILGNKFQLKLKILIWTKFAQYSFSGQKQKKWKHHLWMLHIWISLGTKFQLKLTVLVFWTKFVQKGWVKNRKSKHHYWILQIRIILVGKFRLKPTILDFWIKFSQ